MCVHPDGRRLRADRSPHNLVTLKLVTLLWIGCRSSCPYESGEIHSWFGRIEHPNTKEPDDCVSEERTPAVRCGAEPRGALSCLILGKWNNQDGQNHACILHFVIPFAVFFASLRSIRRLFKNTAEEKSLSELRLIRTQRDATAYRKLMLARYYHATQLKFLTLTFKDKLLEDGKNNPYKLKLKALMLFLRQKHDIEYLAVETREGNAVFHLALICGFIHHTKIREWWRENTGAWNVHISREKNLPAFLSEMTGQQETMRYSMSRNFIPKGSIRGLARLKYHFSGKDLNRACIMYARRLKSVPLEIAVDQTVKCIERGVGTYSDLRSKKQVFVGKTNG